MPKMRRNVRGIIMKLETIRSQVYETFISSDRIDVSVSAWGNCEGANLMVTHKDTGAVIMSGALRWEVMDLVVAAISVARAE